MITVIEYITAVVMTVMLCIILCSFRKEYPANVFAKRIIIAVTGMIFSVGTVIKIHSVPKELITVICAFGVILSVTAFLFSFPKAGLEAENDTWEDS